MICRICLKRSDSRLFKVEDYLLNLYLNITKINVCSTASLPENVCNDCIKTLEDISLFIDNSMYNNKRSEKKFMLKNENNHEESAECRISQKHVMESEETIEEYEEDFKGFESCRICYSTNILKPVEEKEHLMQLFQNITNIDVKADRNCICNKCIKKLEILSLFISVSLCNEIKLKNTIERNEAVETENCLEGNAIDMGYCIKVNEADDFNKNVHSYASKSLHTIIDIKEEIVDTPEASTEQMKQNGKKYFSESHSEENVLDYGPCKDEFSTGTNLKNLLKGLDINLVIQSGTDQFKCERCDEIFTQKQTLKSHSITDTEKKNLKCNYCKKTFNCESNVQKHFHTEARPFKCECCERSFSQKGHLQQHMVIHTGEKSFKCDSCAKSFSRKSNLKQHMLIHTGHNKSFQCGCCEKTYALKKSLKSHLLTHTGQKPFTCDCCQKTFAFQQSLETHILTHNRGKPFKCDSCEKSFIAKGKLQKHMLIHTREKPFQCGCCEKTFFLKGNLKTHLLTHTGIKPFKCDFCEKSFTQKWNLQQHMLIHTGEKPFQCDCCKKTFAFKHNLKSHLLTHLEKSLKCDCCKKSFAFKHRLKSHLLTHTEKKSLKCDTEKKSLKCDFCEKSFPFKQRLKRHLLIHTGEKPFQCDCCKKTFNQKNSLQKHLLTHTKKVLC